MSECLVATPSQTVGPFFHLGLDGVAAPETVAGAVGHPVTIEGTVIDGAGEPVNDALIEIWQADARGAYATGSEPAAFRGFTRVATDDAGRFRIKTIMPGRVSGPGATQQAPHLLVVIFMRGLLRHLFTRLYFPDVADNDADPILNLVDAARRRTLLATRRPGSSDVFNWDIRLQGDAETVFFDV
jgi:protocatechuate 3,4-dioxygenase, alpha subunit